MNGIDRTAVSGRCTNCGSPLPPASASGLCPKCLLLAGFRTEPLAAETQPPAPRARRGLPQPGEDFGHYHLVRSLGQGGMGSVYEAEDRDTGRRLALKVLSQALDSPEARQRFLREGQLAASINHPNSVYVFGTEEIAGIPVIAMELVPGGTLQERVAASGPLPISEAVDCVLQVIAGLEAAQQTGILHRDVKPSNCFVDTDGTVKIGDFGLSIGTSVRTEPALTTAGTLLGTPAYSSPEQLRGEELTVRSDIYAVGVTLYFLLTGRRPFEAENVVQLLATVLERRPESPAKYRAGMPAGLARAVLRCLEKDAGQRFASYARLREALLPYTLADATPATLGLRFLAGCIDLLLLVPLLYRLCQPVGGWWGTLVFYASALAYFALLEGLWGASLGKLILRLRVVRRGRNRPSLPHAALRALVFLSSLFLTDLAAALILGIKEGGGGSNLAQAAQGLGAICFLSVFLALLFCTARRRNGFAALQDWLSGTQVVSQTAWLARALLPAASDPRPNLDGAPQVGPYHLLQKLGESDGAEMFLAYDTRLLRKVWVRRQPLDARSIPATLRNLARPGRLRWLNGRRSATEAWDAYQAVEGQPLLALLTTPQPWATVRFWLLDIAAELEAAGADHSAPDTLELARVWLSADGHALLLDFPAFGLAQPALAPAAGAADAPASPDAGPAVDAPAFLRQIALSALHGRVFNAAEAKESTLTVPVPLHARLFVEALSGATDAGEAVRRLTPLLHKLTVVSRARRLALFAGMLCPPLILSGTVLLVRRADVQGPAWLLVLTWLYGITVVILPCWLAALVFRGGPVLRGLGVAVVRRDGRAASRARVLWRNLVASLPFLILPGAAAVYGFQADNLQTGWVCLLSLTTLTLLSLLLPRRSLQDRLAGTVLVPR